MMIQAADPGVSAPPGWAVLFFASAQTTAVAVLLAGLRAVAMRDEGGTPADVMLLCRRNSVALGFALVTMFAAGGGVTGSTDVWRILLGPATAAIASIALVRAARLARPHRQDRARTVRAPLDDLTRLARRTAGDRPARGRLSRPSVILVATTLVAAGGAFWWNHLDHGTTAGSGVAAGIESACVLAGFALLGPVLGPHAAPIRRRHALRRTSG
ncbi:hypothetical protein [Nocardioides panacisoli]